MYRGEMGIARTLAVETGLGKLFLRHLAIAVVVGEEVEGEGFELGLRQELHTENLSNT